jgi:hypothetical protein
MVLARTNKHTNDDGLKRLTDHPLQYVAQAKHTSPGETSQMLHSQAGPRTTKANKEQIQESRKSTTANGRGNSKK